MVGDLLITDDYCPKNIKTSHYGFLSFPYRQFLLVQGGWGVGGQWGEITNQFNVAIVSKGRLTKTEDKQSGKTDYKAWLVGQMASQAGLTQAGGFQTEEPQFCQKRHISCFKF